MRVAALVLLLGCSSNATVDASSVDAASVDAAFTIDAAPTIDSPLTIDAAAPTVDAAPPTADAARPDVAGEVGPALAECFSGAFFSDCGGAGPPRLACNDGANYSGDCRWFSGGVLANGYHASDCPADDICCHDEWPYAHPRDYTGFPLAFFAYGRQPWDRSREMNLDVVVDPSLPTEPPGYVCEGTDPFEPPGQVPCRYFRNPFVTNGAVPGTSSFDLHYAEFGGWFPRIEIDPATRRARVCMRFFSDVVESRCPPDFANFQVHCAAVGGTLVLNRLPTTLADFDGLHGRFDVTLSTLRLKATF